MAYFFSKRTNDDKELEEAKKGIILTLLEWPVSLSYIESEFNKNGIGKTANRNIVRTTTTTLLIFLGLYILFYVCSGYVRNTVYFSFIVYVVYWVLIFLLRWEIHYTWGKEEKIKQTCEYLYSTEKYNLKDRIRIWCLMNVPFSLRTIWFWSFILSVSLVLVQDKYQIKVNTTCETHFAAGFGMDHFNEFIIDFLKALVIAIISYIATNIINELLNLRENYATNNNQLKSFKDNLEAFHETFMTVEKKITESEKNIENLNKSITDTIGSVYLRESFREVSQSLEKLQNSLHTDTNKEYIKSYFNDFVMTLKNQLNIYSTKTTNDGDVNFWLLNSVNEYYKIASEDFNKNNILTTKFQLFSKILYSSLEPILKNNELLSSFNSNFQIYTLLVLPPSRLLNFHKGKYIDGEWREFLLGNRRFANHKIEIRRHFLCLNFDINNLQEVEKYFGDDSYELNIDQVKEQLNRFYYLKNNQRGSNGELISDFELETKDYIDENNDFKYDQDGNKIICYPHTDDKTNKKNLVNLSEIINAIHYNNSARIIELELLDVKDVNSLKNMEGILWDSNSDRAIDYFAIFNKISNEWVFCFKTIYDPSVNFARVSINYNPNLLLNKASDGLNSKNWNSICSSLNKLFIPSESDSDKAGKIIENKDLNVKIYSINDFLNN